MSQLEQYQELNEKLSRLVLMLQKEVKELKEDTLINAYAIKDLQSNSSEDIKMVTNVVEGHLDNTSEIIQEIVEKNEENSEENYTKFLKTLLIEDFTKKQKELLERSNQNTIITNSKNSDSFVSYLSFFVSLFSLGFLLFICFKFNLFSQLF
ncbi:hypothetical protein FQW77_08670 [Campylobacter jejuni]|nr:hypothetical protein [Campylobacter jejuni]